MWEFAASLVQSRLCERETKLRDTKLSGASVPFASGGRADSGAIRARTRKTSSQDESAQQPHCHCPPCGFLTGTGSGPYSSGAKQIGVAETTWFCTVQ